ncbi:MAG TPA: type II toxin-antitoxin system VapC family toxin [Acetobacteraceae bacterium]
MYLLDTNVVSELRRIRPHGAVLAWVSSVRDADLHLSAVTIGELQTGVERTRDRDAARATELEAWIMQIVGGYIILPMDGPAFREWARLMHRRSGTLAQDAMIAATAAVYDLIVATRNVRDFTPLGIRTVNPFEA